MNNINNKKTGIVKGIKEFGILNTNNLINIYSDENPILGIGQHTYFLFNSLVDAHIPLIGYGRIINDKFINGMDKNYTIELLKIHSSSHIQDKFAFSDNLFKIYGKNENIKATPLIIKLNNKILTEKPIFIIHCFFVRPELDKIQKLLIDYKNVVLTDLKKQVKDLEEI